MKTLGRLGRLGWLLFGAYLLCTYGCATAGSSTIPVSDGQAQAVDIVWHEVYGRTDRPPLIRWRQGAALECTDPNSGKPGFVIIDADPSDPSDEGPARCREGLTMSFLECIVAWHGERSFSETVMAHELWHVAQARALVFDSGHQTPGFQHADWCQAHGMPLDHGECGIVDRANVAIQAAGR